MSKVICGTRSGKGKKGVQGDDVFYSSNGWMEEKSSSMIICCGKYGERVDVRFREMGRWGSRVEGGVSSQYLELESEVGNLNLFIASVEFSSGER